MRSGECARYSAFSWHVVRMPLNQGRMLFRLLAILLLISSSSGWQNRAAGEVRQTHVNSKGDTVMTGDEIAAELRRLDFRDQAGIDRLARLVVDQTRTSLRSVVTLASGPDQALAQKARSLLSNVDDLAIVPLLEGPEPSDPFARVWQMNTVMSAQLELRDRVVAKLDSMLTDKTSIPWQTIEPIEGVPQPSRVCDEAYLMVRRLLNTKEGKMQFLHESEAFLSLSDKAKDAEILKAKKSRAWTNLVGEEEE